jgi:hypothetical protein
MVTIKNSKIKTAGLQFTSTDYLGLFLTPLRIRWTIPLSRWKCSSCDHVPIKLKKKNGRASSLLARII